MQAIALSLGASFGLHWGSRAPAAAPPEAAPGEGREAAAPKPGATALVGVPLCTDS